MSEPKQPKPERAPDDKWDYETWEAAGRQALLEREQANSAKMRETLIALLNNLTDPTLKTALLGLVNKDHQLLQGDKAVISEQDATAANCFSQDVQVQQASMEKNEAEEKLVKDLKNAINEQVAGHPNLRSEHQKGGVLVGEFEGIYQGEEVQYRLVVPASSEQSEVEKIVRARVWLEIPQKPEPFEPAFTDFGPKTFNKERNEFFYWRKGVSDPVVRVGSLVTLSDRSAYGSLILDNPDAFPINFFGNIPGIDAYDLVDGQLPVAYNSFARDFAQSEVGQATLLNPSLTQLEELQELVASSRPVVE